jgi:hypothetical protein
MIDACDKEAAAIRSVYAETVPVFICTWHMHKATNEMLKKKVSTFKHGDLVSLTLLFI